MAKRKVMYREVYSRERRAVREDRDMNYEGVRTGQINSKPTTRSAPMPTKSSVRAARYVRDEMHTLKRGSSPHVQSRKQAVAVGLSKARRAGVRVPARTSRKRGS